MSGRVLRGRLLEVDDSGDQQTVDLLGPRGETLKKVHRVQPFGFHSSPPKDAHGVVAQLGGEGAGRLLNIALGFESKQHRPRGREQGSTALYDANGNMVSLVGAELRIVGSAKVTIVAPTIVLEGEVHLGGEGGQKVHRKGDVDSDGDVAAGSASKVYAV